MCIRDSVRDVEYRIVLVIESDVPVYGQSFENNRKPIVTRQNLSRRATRGQRFDQNSIKRISLVAGEAPGTTRITGQ